MRTEEEILADLGATRSKYRQASDTARAADMQAISHKVKELMNELSDTISAGAKPCPTCGNAAHGLCFRTIITDGVVSNLYEVGCVVCSDKRARASSAEVAVKRWNSENYYEKAE
jgi:hypothetical protein